MLSTRRLGASLSLSNHSRNRPPRVHLVNERAVNTEGDKRRQRVLEVRNLSEFFRRVWALAMHTIYTGRRCCRFWMLQLLEPASRLATAGVSDQTLSNRRSEQTQSCMKPGTLQKRSAPKVDLRSNGTLNCMRCAPTPIAMATLLMSWTQWLSALHTPTHRHVRKACDERLGERSADC